MIRLKLISRDMMPLVPGETYQLEDVAKFSKFVLIKMLELFGETAWGVVDIVGGIRRRLKNYGVFYLKYSKLPEEQKKILTVLAQKPGQVFLVREIAGRQESGDRVQAQREITSLVSTSWLIGGAYKNEMAVFVTAEIASLVNMLPDYLAYLEAEKSADGTATEREFSLFDDLVQLTSHMLTNPIKITNTGHLSKTAVKKLMPRLSRTASRDWERLANENYYPFCFNLLMRICEYIGCVEVKTAETNGQTQFLKVEEWSSYLTMPPDKRLRTAMLAYLGVVRDFPGNDPYVFLEKLLCGGDDDRRSPNFMSPLKLRQTLERDSAGNKYEPGKHGEYYDGLFTCWVLEPLFYLGLVERFAVSMPTPWLRGESETTERYLWRLSPLGVSLAGILKNERKKLSPKFDRRLNDLRSDWLEKALKNDGLFAGRFDDFFPAAVSKELVVQNDMTFFAPQNTPFAFVWLLHVFGEVEQTGYIVGGRFTKDSIIKALKAGIAIDNLTILIKNESKTEPSPTVLRVIEDWSSSYNRAIFAHVTVVVCDTPELAAELSANAKLSKTVLGRLGPQAVFIRHEDEKAVRQWLEKKGRVPLPGVYGCESLAKWVGEYVK